MGFHQIKKFLHGKGNNYQNKKKLTEWKKIVVTYSLDKGLVSRMYKELKKLNTKTPIIK
jgi:hypothetical protein